MKNLGNAKRVKRTKGFSESLYAIKHREKILAVVGACSEDQALLRAEVIRNHVRMPRQELLEASFIESGPLAGTLAVPFFASGYFQWRDCYDDSTCPACCR